MEHYFTESPRSDMIMSKIRARLRNNNIEFYTASGLFSKKSVDKGTELLINKCIMRNNWKVLDLGCGYGIIGLSLLTSYPSLRLTFSDINKRAVKITNINLKFHKLKADVIQSNGFQNIKEKFNTILLNPPQTAGKQLCFRLIEDSEKHLEKNGILQLVARHNKGGKELSKKMLEIFGNIKETAKASGYRLYVSQKA